MGKLYFPLHRLIEKFNLFCFKCVRVHQNRCIFIYSYSCISSTFWAKTLEPYSATLQLFARIRNIFFYTQQASVLHLLRSSYIFPHNILAFCFLSSAVIFIFHETFFEFFLFFLIISSRRTFRHFLYIWKRNMKKKKKKKL